MNKLTFILISLFSIAQAEVDYLLPETLIAKEKLSATDNPNGLIKVAAATLIDDISLNKGQATSGQWIQLDADTWQWIINFHSKNAVSLNIGMSDVFLPYSAELQVFGKDKFYQPHSFSDEHNTKHGFLWSGEILGDQAKMVLTVNAKEKAFVKFNIQNVARGFHQHGSETLNQKSGSCNIDVACPEGEGWEAEINSVGRYVFQTNGGGYYCTGQLINNTAKDGKPYFLTADHCGYSGENGQASLNERQNVAASIQLIWNYQSQTCRAPGSSISGNSISTSTFNNRQSGATYRASNPYSDVALVELNQTPLLAYGVEYTGWDRSNTVPNSATSIHHPSGDAKRISHENDALSLTSYGGETGSGNSHFRINDWDSGTTEGGSSGAGLWNANNLLIGQLHGGSASCGNDEPDWYGRFSESWDQGSSAQSRLKDWLDPLNTQQMTLQGSAGCEAPTLEISVLGDQKVGVPLTLSAQATGGSGGYQFEWDTNADDIIDAKSKDVNITFNQAFINNVNVKVTDSEGCFSQATQALAIQSPDIKIMDVQNIQSELMQMCGNNDAVIDPGERWKTRVHFENQGQTTASGTYAALSKNRGVTTAPSGSSDHYGNSSGTCQSHFIDISNSGELIDWNIGTNEYPAHDEGATANIEIQYSKLYGIGFTNLRASSNGYLSNGNITGIDFSNDCPLPQVASHDAGTARIAPMHGDLQNSDFYHQSFTDCPRAAESGNNLACEIFMWKGADFWNTDAIENVDFQAILYPATGQWTYQYQGQDIDGSNSTTGIQNAEGNDGISFACNQTGSISQNQAVCIFDKNHPNLSQDPQSIFIETPALALGKLAANATTSEDLVFSVRPDAACGKSFSINHEATVFDEGFNPGGGSILEAEIGDNGMCSVITHCDINDRSDITANNGLWWNPVRSGNGTDFHFIDNQRLVYVNYTGLPDRSPIWYITGAEDEEANQYYNSLLYVHHNGPFTVGQGINESVGWSNTTLIDENNLIQTRQIGDDFSAEKMQWYQFAAPPTVSQHTGLWYTPSQAGWGESISTQGQVRGVVHYLYDASGEPYWTIGWGENNDSSLDMIYTQSFCPSCPRIEPDNTVVGSSQLTLTDQYSGTLNNINIQVPSSLKNNATWQKNNLPVNNLAPTDNQ
ncbi:trypsin-like serine peptidase [Marinicella rhabdoformis]|uniref:trypsin-like serine peptidase n=1 Tax=Marinicella rhabdoformis TaxID=2580566 RepID=UPI0012AEC973|nr:trypsin-like peptidase domain-containing protein [Marinicella rhabdoformis]